MIKLGIIGYGGRGSGLVRIMEQLPFGATLTAIADVNRPGVLKQLAKREKDPNAIRLYDQPDEMLAREPLDAVIVATRCSQHTTMATKVLARGLPLYLEKPVATSLEDYRRLAEAARTAKAPTMVSFPLRVTAVAQQAKRIIESGQLGAISHVQGTNNVPYGEVYFQTWYRDENETGGLFLQKATHDIDAINALIGEADPVRVAGMVSKRVFRGDKPAGLRCTDCGEKLTCLESKFNPTASTGAGFQAKPEEYLCCFATDTGNEDSGDALIEYANGVRANYSQNFYSRRGAAVRRIRCIGNLGTIEFDWNSERATVWMAHSSRVETHDCSTKDESHGGGDKALAMNFLQCVRGEAESISPLSAGLRSVLICLLARESARTGKIQEVR
ncbi:MAG: Gfo/Idh/MocA family oxidoreductase [Phycisphaerae bacterium]|nr:Gfo/Idh/MocA family oxidoreductase [Phycisphaerae bacterium]